MAVFSKLVKAPRTIFKYFTSNMWGIDEAFPPYGGLISALSTLALCIASYYIMKWIGGDVTVPIRDVSKTHNWKDVKITTQVRNCK